MTYEEQQKQSKENSVFYKTINRGGSFEFFYENLGPMIFYTSNISTKSEDELYYKCLDNFIAMVLDELELDSIDVYFDKTLRTEETQRIAYAGLDNEIFLPTDIFKSLTDNIFYDMYVISHELKHVNLGEHNNIVRKLDGNSDRYISSPNPNLLENLGFDKEHIMAFYILNENEFLANKFGFTFVDNLINKAIKLNNMSKEKHLAPTQLLKFYKKNLKENWAIQKKHIKKIKKPYEKVLIPLLKEVQNELYDYVITLTDTYYKVNNKKKSDLIHDIIFEKLANLYASFSICYNEEVINKIKNYTLNNYMEYPILIVYFGLLFNTNTHTATKREFKQFISMSENLDTPVPFESLNIDKQNLIENYLDIKCNFDYCKFSKEDILNLIELDKIKTNDDLFKQIYEKTRIEKTRIARNNFFI